MRVATLIRTTLVVAALASALSACGRRPANLDTPYDAAVEARREAQRNNEAVPDAPAPPVEDRRFILDGLI